MTPESADPNNETPARRPGDLAAAVAAEVANQRHAAEMDAIDEAALADPAFDKRSGTSNFGKRVGARLQQAVRP